MDKGAVYNRVTFYLIILCPLQFGISCIEFVLNCTVVVL